jgi:hypothetical protein
MPTTVATHVVGAAAKPRSTTSGAVLLPRSEHAINEKHESLGGNDGLLGVPIEEMKGCPDGIGSFRRYSNGMIYWSPSTDAHEIHGAILDKWSSLGFERSFLGYPVGDETGTPDAVGRFSQFQGGMIYWTPVTGAHEVHGAILEQWGSLGFEKSFLGYPTSDESDLGVNNGRFSSFQKGQIAWSPTFGAAVSSSLSLPISGGGIRPQGLPADGVPEIRRRVVASAHMEITDDETFGTNEHNSADQQVEVAITNKQPRALMKLIGKCGGEVRVELTLNASASTEGDVQVSGTAELFEGISDESDDLDGTTPVNFTVPCDDVITNLPITVRNTDEGGDFADIVLTVSNFAA